MDDRKEGESSKQPESKSKGYISFANFKVWKEKGKPNEVLTILPEGAVQCSAEEMGRALDREQNWGSGCISWKPEKPHYCYLEV